MIAVCDAVSDYVSAALVNTSTYVFNIVLICMTSLTASHTAVPESRVNVTAVCDAVSDLCKNRVYLGRHDDDVIILMTF